MCISSRFGTWQLASWDQREKPITYHAPILAGAMALAVLVAVLGIGLSAQQARAARLAAQRVSFVNRVSHELIARIQTALRRARPATSPATASFDLCPLRILPSEPRAERGTESIELTPRKISILKLLHDHPGQVISRDTMPDDSRCLECLPEIRTLDQQIAKLRKIIERADEIIETVRGSGHRWRGQL